MSEIPSTADYEAMPPPVTSRIVAARAAAMKKKRSTGLQECTFCGRKTVWPPDEGGLFHAHRGCYMDYCQCLAERHAIVEGERIPPEEW